MFPLSLISAGIGGIGALGGLFNMFGSGNKLKKLYAQEPEYKANPLAADRMSLAQTLLNARMPGATAMERNIYQNQANQLANVNRNATDSSQALALGGAAQAQTNQAFQNLGVQESQDYYNRLNNLNTAQQGVIAEGDKVFQDKVRRFNDLAGLTGAGMQNTQNAWNSLANLGFGGASLAAQWGMTNQQQMPGNATSINPYGRDNSFMGMRPVDTRGGYGPVTPGGINPNTTFGVPPPYMQIGNYGT